MATEHLKLSNFQCHESLDLEFTPGAITVIVGDNDVGKSSVFRALEYLLENSNSRSDLQCYRRWGSEKPFEIAYTFADGRTLSRRRSNSLNSYRLTDESGNQITHTSVKKGGIPEEISAHIQTRPSAKVFNDSSILLCPQIGNRFFVDSGQIAAYELLLHIVDVSGLSTARQVRRRDHTSFKKEHSELSDTCDGLSDEYVKYLWVDGALIDCIRNRDVVNGLLKRVATLERLNSIRESRDNLTNRINVMGSYNQELLTFLEGQLAWYTAIVGKWTRVNLLHSIQGNILTTLAKLDDARSTLSGSQEEYTALSDKFGRCEGIFKRIGILYGACKMYHDLQRGLAEAESKLEHIRGEVKDAANELQEFLDSCGICPTCGRAM